MVQHFIFGHPMCLHYTPCRNLHKSCWVTSDVNARSFSGKIKSRMSMYSYHMVICICLQQEFDRRLEESSILVLLMPAKK